MNDLWHYTCDHGREGIGLQGALITPAELTHVDESNYPAWQRPMFGLVWMTNLPAPDRLGLGLTSFSLACDRTEYRYRVTDQIACHSWMSVRKTLDKRLVAELEREPGVRPAHWWVSWAHVPVAFAPRAVAGAA